MLIDNENWWDETLTPNLAAHKGPAYRSGGSGVAVGMGTTPSEGWQRMSETGVGTLADGS